MLIFDFVLLVIAVILCAYALVISIKLIKKKKEGSQFAFILLVATFAYYYFVPFINNESDILIKNIELILGLISQGALFGWLLILLNTKKE